MVIKFNGGVKMGIQEIKNKNVYILDVSYHLYRCYYSLRNLTVKLSSGIERPTGHIFGILNTLETIYEYDKDCLIFLVTDGYPKERRQIMQENHIPYKEGRAKLEFNIKQDIGVICQLACLMPNVFLAENEDFEADDVMFSLAKSLDTSNSVYIYTSDNDLLQTLSSNISIIKAWGDNGPIILTEEGYLSSEKYLKEFHSVPPTQLPYYRAMIGDKSDNLKGIPRLPRVVAEVIAKEITDISQLKDPYNFMHLVKTSHNKWVYALAENYQTILLNYRLMRLEVIPFDVFKEDCDLSLLSKFKLSKYNRFLEGEFDLCRI